MRQGRPRTHRRTARTVLAAMLCLALVWPFALTFPLGSAQAAADPLRFVPTTALMYAQVDLRQTSSQGSALNHLLGIFTHQKGYAAAIHALEGSISMSSADMTKMQKMIGRFGPYAGVALFGAGTARQPSVTGLVVLPLGKSLTAPTDVFGTLRDLLSSARPTGLYYGHILYTISFGGTALPGAVVNGTLVLGASDSASQADHLVQVALDAVDGRRPSLGGSPSVARVLSTLPAQRLAYTFINSKRLLQWALSLQGGQGNVAGTGLSAKQLQNLIAQLPPLGVAVQALPGGLRIVTSESASAPASLAPRVLNGLSARYADPDSLAYLAVAGLGGSVLDSMRQSQKTLGGGAVGTSHDLLHTTLGLGAIEQQLHLNVETGVLPLLNGELGLGVSVRPGALKASNSAAQLLKLVRVHAALQLTDAGALGTVMAKINTWLHNQTASGWQRISPTTRGMMEPTTAIGYKMNDQWLLAGTQINEHWVGGLNTSATFSEALHAVADLGAGGQSRPTALLYINLEATRNLVGEALSSTDVATYRREVLPFLTPLHAMTLASRVGADGSQSVALFVGIR